MQKAIEEAKKMRDELAKMQLTNSYMEYRHIKIDALNELIERLKVIQQEPTTDELLEEMAKNWFQPQLEFWNWTWFLEIFDTTWDKSRYKWKTPRLALIALKDKLSTNQ